MKNALEEQIQNLIVRMTVIENRQAKIEHALDTIIDQLDKVTEIIETMGKIVKK